MRSTSLVLFILFSLSAGATVVDLEDSAPETVLRVYEEMREEQESIGGENEWIHEFEDAPVGTEMDHLSALSGKETVTARPE